MYSLWLVCIIHWFISVYVGVLRCACMCVCYHRRKSHMLMNPKLCRPSRSVYVPLDHFSTVWTWSILCVTCEVVQCRHSGSYQSVFLLSSSAFLTTTPYWCCQSRLSSATQFAGEGMECPLHSPPLLPTITSPPPLWTDRRCVVCVC